MFNFSINHPNLQFSCPCTCPMNIMLCTFSVFNSAANGHRVTFVFCFKVVSDDVVVVRVVVVGLLTGGQVPTGCVRPAAACTSRWWITTSRCAQARWINPCTTPRSDMTRDPLYRPMHKRRWIAWITDVHIHNPGGSLCTAP